MTRTEIINRLIETFAYQHYMEIGIDHTSINFDKIACKNKTGVDPKPITAPNIKTQTSDDFFKSNKQKFDLIFIDGLHHAEQVKRDIQNALDYLNDNGTIVVHDCNPTTKEMQIVPRMQGVWTGDVWRAWVEFRKRPDLFMTVMDTDYGVGIIRKGRQTPVIVENPTYEQFAVNKKEWLNLIDIQNEPVSICIPAFEQYGHGVRTLTGLLDSIKRQKGTFEVIVSDNSLDGKIKELCASYDVKYYHNPTRGISANTNYALERASHDIVKIMYQDDLFMTDDAIDTISFAMMFNNWIACSGVRIDGAGKHGKPVNPKYTSEIMRGTNTLGMPSVTAHRKSKIRFDESLRVMLDCEYYYLMNERWGEPGYVRKQIICPRYWDGSTSVKQGNRNFLAKEVEYLAGKHNLVRAKRRRA